MDWFTLRRSEAGWVDQVGRVWVVAENVAQEICEAAEHLEEEADQKLECDGPLLTENGRGFYRGQRRTAKWFRKLAEERLRGEQQEPEGQRIEGRARLGLTLDRREQHNLSVVISDTEHRQLFGAHGFSEFAVLLIPRPSSTPESADAHTEHSEE
jgi:hypothetical protein